MKQSTPAHRMSCIRLHPWLMATLMAVLCTGCLYSRLLAFKRQLADFDQHVTLADGGTTLAFRKPVVRPADILYLAGFPPTRTNATPDGREVHTYIHRSLSPAPPPERPLRLKFKLDYTDGRLTAFHYPATIAEVLGTNLIALAARAIGQSSVNQKDYRLDWSTLSTNFALYVPTRDKIAGVFGPALAASNTPTGPAVCYVFNLERPDGRLKTNAVLAADFLFDPGNMRLRQGTIRIGKFVLTVAFPALP